MLDIENIQILWDYHHLNQKITPADGIIGIGCHDLHVAERVSELFLSGYGKYIIFTGGLWRITKAIRNKPEAQKFAEIAIQKGVPKNSIYIEDKSQNTGENIKYTKQVIKENNIITNNVIIVSKPIQERRVYATIKKQRPELKFKITSPQYSLQEYIDYYKNFPEVTVENFINVMVWDTQRMDIYWKNGFQIRQKIPKTVRNAYHKLVEQGYNKQLI